MKGLICLKKLTAVILIVAAFLLCACTRQENTAQKPSFENLVSYVSFEENECTVKGILCCGLDGKVTFTVTEPESIKKITFSATSSANEIRYDNFSVSKQRLSVFPDETNGLDNLFEVIFSCFSNEPKKTVSSQYTVKYPSGEAIITLDKDGQIKSVRAGEYDYTFTRSPESA